jgi:ATP-dependent DNA helicase RecG
VPLRDRRGLTAVGRELLPADSLTQLKGIGPKSADALAAEGIHSVLDLLLHLPRRYEDRTRTTGLDTPLEPGSWVLLRGRVVGVRQRRIPGRRLLIVDGVVDDGLGRLKVVWFNQRWIHRRVADEPELYLYGQLREQRGGGIQLVNPEIEETGDEVERVVPVYRRLGRFGGRRLRRLIEQCAPAALLCSDPLPEATRKRYGLPTLADTLLELHTPKCPEDGEDRAETLQALNQGRSRFHLRLAFDELLAFACAMGSRRVARRSAAAPQIDTSAVDADRLRRLLPFELTSAQGRVLREIAGDLGGRQPMARLIQGDVGSGKTVVAAMAMLMALDSGYQVAFMAPTELLAEQHARTFSGLLERAGHPTHQLTGSLPAAEQRRVREGLADGSLQLVVGTHALFQESVTFDKLGLVVVDEQHRFGVTQRRALAEKGHAPHLLVMTATPIPRSLALTLYGDLDLSIIDEMPPGRRPVETHLRFEDARSKIFDFLRQEIDEGGRVFVVYPLIDASNELEAAALTEREDAVRRALPGVEIAVLHGRLDRAARESAISGFRDGSVQVLLATTVVEVGVDVPEASAMVIESAQRFGLSQLHQLRGRVGRGERQAWCILMADDGLGEEARRRLEVVCESNDGFEIAEADLELRGPGELTGIRQWGPAGFRFANLFRDREMISLTRDLAAEAESSRDLEGLLEALGAYHKVEVGWAGD